MNAPVPAPVSPDTVTTGQLIGGFTGKHWAYLIGSTFAAFSAVAGGGFWMGQHLAQAKAETQAATSAGALATQVVALGQAQTDLKVSAARVAQLVEANATLHRAHQATLDELAQQRREVLALSTALGKAHNCTFIHEQIRATKVELQSTGSMVVFESGEAWQRKQAERRAALESQLAGYQQQLGTCNK